MKRIVDNEPWDARCAARHFGPWLVEPRWFAEAVAAVKAGTFPVIESQKVRKVRDESDRRYTLYDIDGNQTAIVPIEGHMIKGDSKYGGTNTVRARQAIRKAVDDGDVKSILLHVDSPGGTVAGTADLAREVRDANAKKPVYAHIDDLGASAAYWAASQARSITANQTAEIGSIGVLAIVNDLSGAAEMEGIKVHVISTGDYKGAFAPGTEVTDDQLKYLQGVVNDVFAFFRADVMSGRGMAREAFDRVADGRTWIASKAKGLGLIDAVQSMDRTLEQIAAGRRPARRQTAEVAIELESI